MFKGTLNYELPTCVSSSASNWIAISTGNHMILSAILNK